MKTLSSLFSSSPSTLPSHQDLYEKAKLDPLQQEALDAVCRGQSVLITGGAGTGKSFLLHVIRKHLSSFTTFITATTGIAALPLEGTTIHHFSGIELGNTSLSNMLNMAKTGPSLSRWKRCRTLIIDEVSMLSAKLFDTLEFIARKVRHSEEPFGGIQLILCGDFLQLPPISSSHQRGQKGATPVLMCFQAESWIRVNPKIFVLQTIFRQKEDKFIRLLGELRVGHVSRTSLLDLLSLSEEMTLPEPSSCIPFCGGKKPSKRVLDEVIGISDPITRLASLRREVEAINQTFFQKLPPPTHLFRVFMTGDPRGIRSGVPEVLSLRVGSRIMLMKNISIAEGFVNGSLGTVVDFISLKAIQRNNMEGRVGGGNWSLRHPKTSMEDLVRIAVNSQENLVFPIVRFDVLSPVHEKEKSHMDILIEPTRWSTMIGEEEVGSLIQFPLQLAWVLTIHKSQGMTLQGRVEVNFEGIFESGQAYVALSRGTQFETLRLIQLYLPSIAANREALIFYAANQLFIHGPPFCSPSSSEIALTSPVTGWLMWFPDGALENSSFVHEGIISRNLQKCLVGLSTENLIWIVMTMSLSLESEEGFPYRTSVWLSGRGRGVLEALHNVLLSSMSSASPFLPLTSTFCYSSSLSHPLALSNYCIMMDLSSLLHLVISSKRQTKRAREKDDFFSEGGPISPHSTQGEWMKGTKERDEEQLDIKWRQWFEGNMVSLSKDMLYDRLLPLGFTSFPYLCESSCSSEAPPDMTTPDPLLDSAISPSNLFSCSSLSDKSIRLKENPKEAEKNEKDMATSMLEIWIRETQCVLPQGEGKEWKLFPDTAIGMNYENQDAGRGYRSTSPITVESSVSSVSVFEEKEDKLDVFKRVEKWISTLQPMTVRRTWRLIRWLYHKGWIEFSYCDKLAKPGSSMDDNFQIENSGYASSPIASTSFHMYEKDNTDYQHIISQVNQWKEAGFSRIAVCTEDSSLLKVLRSIDSIVVCSIHHLHEAKSISFG